MKLTQERQSSIYGYATGRCFGMPGSLTPNTSSGIATGCSWTSWQGHGGAPWGNVGPIHQAMIESLGKLYRDHVQKPWHVRLPQKRCTATPSRHRGSSAPRFASLMRHPARLMQSVRSLNGYIVRVRVHARFVPLRAAKSKSSQLPLGTRENPDLTQYDWGNRIESAFYDLNNGRVTFCDRVKSQRPQRRQSPLRHQHRHPRRSRHCPAPRQSRLRLPHLLRNRYRDNKRPHYHPPHDQRLPR
jgi:hypothetical protein